MLEDTEISTESRNVPQILPIVEVEMNLCYPEVFFSLQHGHFVFPSMIVEQDALKTSLQSTNLCKHQLIAGCKVLVILSPKDLHPVRKQLEEPWHKKHSQLGKCR